MSQPPRHFGEIAILDSYLETVTEPESTDCNRNSLTIIRGQWQQSATAAAPKHFNYVTVSCNRVQ